MDDISEAESSVEEKTPEVQDYGDSYEGQRIDPELKKEAIDYFEREIEGFEKAGWEVTVIKTPYPDRVHVNDNTYLHP